MKQLISTLCLMLLMVGATIAQRSVSGTVSGSDGGPLIGASVRVKGTTRGTVTDLNGRYTVEVPNGANTLVFSYTGFDSKEMVLGASNVLDVTMAEGKLLEETVITAIGSKRNKSDVVYANQTVNSDDLNSTANRSALNALQGKVAGVKIGSASGAVGASTRVVLRGETSLTQGNNALIVVDGIPLNNTSASGGGGTGTSGDRDNYVDFGNRGNDINPDDIENVTVLKGPAATTLYGSRGGSGVILITTKKGKKSTKPNINVSSSVSQDKAYILYKYQERFGSGYASCGGCGGSTQIFMGENFAWGAEFDGRLIPWTAVPLGEDHATPVPLSNGKIEQLVRPYSAVPNNLQNFFDIGSTVRNSVSVDGASDKFNYYVGYTNFNNLGIVHNTKMQKHNLTLNVGSKFSDKLRSDFGMTYTKTNQRGATEGGYPFGYSSGLPAMAFATQTPSNIPFNEIRDWNSPYHDFKGFYAQYSINPFYILDNQELRNTVDNILGNVSMTYSPMKNLDILGRIGSNFTTSNVTEKGPKFDYVSAGTWADGEIVDGGRGGNTFALGYYKESTDRDIQMTYDLSANYHRDLNDNWKLNTIVGYNSIDQEYRRVAATTVGGLVIPGYYALSNSVEPARSELSTAGRPHATKYRLMGIYGNASASYKGWLNLEYSARNDWSSTLPEGNRGFFYQGGGFNIVPTNLEGFNAGPANYLKFRAGLGSSGKDAPIYRLNSYYGLSPLLYNAGDDFQVTFPFNGVAGAQTLNRIGNPDLKPELSRTYEVGADVGLWNNRLELEYTYYYINSTNQIVDVNIPWSSGFSILPSNIGRMTNRGHELSWRLNALNTEKLNLKLYGSWAKNKNRVEEIIANDANDDELVIYGGLVHFSGRGTLNLLAVEGLPFGTFKGTGFVYDPQGRIVVDANGNPLQSPTQEYLGNYQPDWIGSIGTEIKLFNRVAIRALLDGRKGGVFYSGTKLSTEFNGTAITTLINDRKPFVVENSVQQDGNGGYVTNTTETQAYSYMSGLPAGANLLDASFLKLREAAITYSFPKANIGAFNGITVGLFGRNLKYWVAKENTFADPEVGGVGGASDAAGIETTTTPTARSFGAEVRLNF